MSNPRWMIYGATGYTGQLVAAAAVAAGLRPVLAGRSAQRLALMADHLDLRPHAFGLDSEDRIAASLKDIHVVVNCAGPFSRTALPMFEACLRSGTHYVDITGEIAVFEALAARDAEAGAVGIMVLPGAGFDVVPSDCLIADLAGRHPGGHVLRLGLSTRGGASRGTIRTAAESVNDFRIRRSGVITRVAPGSLRHPFDFGDGPAESLVSFLADVSTAWWSTGIADIETYGRAGSRSRKRAWLLRWVGWLLAGRMGQALLNRRIDRRPAGPSEAQRREGYGVFVVEIEDPEGGRVAARMRVDDPYGFTAKTAVAVAVRVLEGDFKAGFQTPSSAYGADFIRQFEGVEWELLDG